MLSFHVNFVQTDRRTDRLTMVKQCASYLSMQGHNKIHLKPVYQVIIMEKHSLSQLIFEHQNTELIDTSTGGLCLRCLRDV